MNHADIHCSILAHVIAFDSTHDVISPAMAVRLVRSIDHTLGSSTELAACVNMSLPYIYIWGLEIFLKLAVQLDVFAIFAD